MKKTAISLALIFVLVFSSMMMPVYAGDDCPNWVEVNWGPVYCNLWACNTLTGYIYKVTERDTCTGTEIIHNVLSFCGVCIP